MCAASGKIPKPGVIGVTFEANVLNCKPDADDGNKSVLLEARVTLTHPTRVQPI